MTWFATNGPIPVTHAALAVALAAMGMFVANTDPPGRAVMGFLLMFAAVIVGVRAARSRVPAWTTPAALAAGAIIAAVAAFLIHSHHVEAPLFAQGPNVPSVTAAASSESPTPSQAAAAIDRARQLARTAITEQNLPGVSIAVGIGPAAGHLIWAEGFGLRDVATRAPVTPETRFNIGTAARTITPAAVAALGLAHTGAEPASEWSPDHIGEPEEDFPGFTAVHDLILRPLGISDPRQPLPGNRATFYVPSTFWGNFTTDPRTGRRLMYMRDLACCAGNMAFYSTPSDLVRFALATNAASVNGDLAGGSVMSLLTRRGNGILVVAVTSNIAHANTAALAQAVADTFAERQ